MMDISICISTKFDLADAPRARDEQQQQKHARDTHFRW